MTNNITGVLSTLIQGGDVPLKAVALAGEIITMDAMLNDHELGASKRASLEQWSAVAEAYDDLLSHVQLAAAEFLKRHDGQALVAALQDIKIRLAAL